MEVLLEKFVNQDDKNVNESEIFVKVPDTWSNYALKGKTLPKQGYATYQLTILVNEQDIGKNVSLYVPSIATAYRLWVNDELILSNGKVAASREHMIPKNYAKIATFQIKQPSVNLFIQVSNYHQRKSGLWETIAFGTVDQIKNLREYNVIFQSFLIGSIFMVGIFQFMLFIHRPKERSLLYIAIVCICVSLRTALLNDTLLIFLFPKLNWQWAVTFEYLSALIALLFFLYQSGVWFTNTLSSQPIFCDFVIVVLFVRNYLSRTNLYKFIFCFSSIDFVNDFHRGCCKY